MAAHCKTCPFRPDAQGRWHDAELAGKVIERTLFNAQQICHGAEGKGREAHNRCKGSYDYNREIYERMGLAYLLK